MQCTGTMAIHFAVHRTLARAELLLFPGHRVIQKEMQSSTRIIGVVHIQEAFAPTYNDADWWALIWQPLNRTARLARGSEMDQGAQHEEAKL